MTRIAFPLLGGAAWTGGLNYLYNLCRVVTSEFSGLVEAVVVTSELDSKGDLARFELLEGVEVRVAPIRLGSQAQWFRALLIGRDDTLERWFDELGIDLVFEAAAFVGWRARRPAIAWVPDFQHRKLPDMFGRSVRWPRDIRLHAQIRSGRTIMLSSRDAERDCLEYFPTARGKTAVARFAIPPEPPRAPDCEVLRRYDLPERFFFLPNQFWLHKNHLGLIEALAMVKEQCPGLVIAASGNPADVRHPGHFESVKNRIDAYGLGGMLRILGFIDYGDVGELLRNSCALVNPSFFEGWSTTVEEAKSLGVPMVLSDLSVHREQAGENALYFDPAEPEAIATTLVDAWGAFDAPGDLSRAEAAVDPSMVRVRDYAAAFKAAVSATLGESLN